MTLHGLFLIDKPTAPQCSVTLRERLQRVSLSDDGHCVFSLPICHWCWLPSQRHCALGSFAWP